MAYTTINKSSDYFNTKLRSGVSSGTQANTGVGFQPDWIWDKNRASGVHAWWDAVRGNTKQLQSNSNGAETTVTQLASFDTDGFTINGGSDHGSGTNIVDWCWKAGGGQGSSNTDGSINTTYTSANTTAGFSISQYTATGNNATVGHGLGVAPKMILFKNLNRTSSNAQSWGVYHQALGNTKFLQLDTTGAENQTSPTSLFFNDTSPTSSVFSIGTNNRVNADAGDTYIAYCFAEKIGYSKFNSYVGNGNLDGTFVYTGFKPAFVMIKRSNATNNWIMFDNKRDPHNEAITVLYANTSDEEDSGTGANDVDFLSNGFKLREDNAECNGSGDSYIYMCFAEAPLVGTNGVTAKAR